MKLQHVQAGSGAGTVAIRIYTSLSELEQASRLTQTSLKIPLAPVDHLEARHFLVLIASFETIRLRCVAGSRHQRIEPAWMLAEGQPTR